ncbi:hypothetical protein Tco_0356965 [Tanacetum coccineum]
MDITRAEQITLDDALVAPANSLKIGRSNLRLRSDLKSKEATLQVVYNVLKLTPFYKAFQIIADVLEIYMQEFWASATVHHHSIRFKMNNKKHIWRDKGVTDVNVNKLHQPWRSFVVGMYHKKNVDYAYLLWEDFVYQIENKNVKRSNEMYYPRFTKVIVKFFMTKDQSIPRMNKLYGAILPNELMNEAIKDSKSYKEYYAFASGAETLKTKASVKKKQARSDKAPKAPKGKRLKAIAKVTKPSKKKLPTQGLETLSEVALTKEEQMRIVTKRRLTQFHSSHSNGSGANEGTGVTPGVPNVPKYGSDDEHISWKSSSDEDDDAESENDNDDDDADNQDDDGQEYDVQDDENQDDDNEQTNSDNDGANVEGEELYKEDTNEEDEANEFYRDVNVNLEGRDTEMTDASRTIIQTTQVIEDTHVIITLVNPEDVLVTTIGEPHLLSTTILPPPTTPLITHLQQTPVPTPTTISSSSLQDLPNFGSLFGFDHRLKTLGTDFSEFKQTNQFAVEVSLIPGIVDAYLANKMHEAVKTAIQLQSDRLRDKAQAENEDFINKLDDNIKKIIKDQTSHAIAANLSELELKKILIDKMESNKSIHISDEQKNLYKALVDAYKSDKLILDMEILSCLKYDEMMRIKMKNPLLDQTEGPKEEELKKNQSQPVHQRKRPPRKLASLLKAKSHHKFADKSAQAEEPMHTAKDLKEPTHQEFVTGDTEDKPNEEASQHPYWFQKLAKPPTTDHDWNKTLHAAHGPIQPWLSTLDYKEDTRESFNELMDTPLDFSAFVMNRLKVDTLTPELLVGPTFELMKGSCKSRQVIPFDHFINNDLAYLSGDASSQTYTTSVTKTKAVDYGHIKWIEDLVLNKMWSQVPHLDWITVRRDDDKLYTFKEGNFNRLRIQDIKDMLLLLVQGKLTNLTVEERLAFNVSL